MRILAMDTTTRAGSVAVLEEREGPCVAVLGVVSTHTDEAYSTRMFRQVEFLLKELSLNSADFDVFAVAAGPGTFTGLRVGLTAVKGWSEVHGKPIVAMSALEAIAFQVQPAVAVAVERIVVIEDARRGQVYGGIYERAEVGLRRMSDDVVMSPAELWMHITAVLGESDFVFATRTPEQVARPILESPFARQRIVAASVVLAPSIGQIAWRKAQRGETCDAMALDAHYVRRTDAEVQFKG